MRWHENPRKDAWEGRGGYEGTGNDRMEIHDVKDTENKYKGEEKMFGDGLRTRTQLSVCQMMGFRGRGSSW